MSEFPEWIEREIGWQTFRNRREAVEVLKHLDHLNEDPRGSQPPIWWRTLWPFDRRRQS